MTSHCTINLYLPNDKCWALFYVLIGHCKSSFVKCLFKTFVHFFFNWVKLIGLFLLFCVWVCWVWIQVFCHCSLHHPDHLGVGFCWLHFFFFFLSTGHIFLFLTKWSVIEYLVLWLIRCRESGFCYMPLKCDFCSSTWLDSTYTPNFCLPSVGQQLKSLLILFSFRLLLSCLAPWGLPHVMCSSAESENFGWIL